MEGHANRKVETLIFQLPALLIDVAPPLAWWMNLALQMGIVRLRLLNVFVVHTQVMEANIPLEQVHAATSAFGILFFNSFHAMAFLDGCFRFFSALLAKLRSTTLSFSTF